MLPPVYQDFSVFANRVILYTSLTSRVHAFSASGVASTVRAPRDSIVWTASAAKSIWSSMIKGLLVWEMALSGPVMVNRFG